MQYMAFGADDHSDVARGNGDALSRSGGLGGGDAVTVRGEVEGRDVQRLGNVAACDLPPAGAGEVVAEQLLDQLASCGEGKGLAFVGPVLELDEPRRLRTARFEAGESREFSDRAKGVEGPEACLKHLHWKGAKPSARSFGVAPHAAERGPRVFRVASEIPRGGERCDALACDQVGGRDRHRSAQAIADKCGRFADAAQQGQKQMLDVASNVEPGPSARLSPIEQERAAAHRGDRGGQGYVLVQVEDSRRVDQRGDEDDRRAASTMVAKAGPLDARRFRLRQGPRPALGILVSAQSGEGFAREIRVVFAGAANQLEEQRERARCAFMLQCRMIRY